MKPPMEIYKFNKLKRLIVYLLKKKHNYDPK